MNGKERISRTLQHQTIDRLGVYEHFWEPTRVLWEEQGFLNPGETPEEHFDFDIERSWCVNTVADLDAKNVIVEEDEYSHLIRDGNGALLRSWKDRSGTPEHVDFEITERTSWEEKIRPLLMDRSHLRRRVKIEEYKKSKERAKEKGRFFCWGSTNVFECMHPVCGHEHMLMGMAIDPDWVRDMCNVYADLLIDAMELCFFEAGPPDGVWFYEDMGFKHRPFMSPELYKQIVWPAHKKTFDFAHSKGCKVIVHSCGFVEPLVPDMIAAGMDCLQAIEIKAGMDLLRLKNNFGQDIALFGGLDIRVLESNDLGQVGQMLESILPTVMEGSGYILHTDHSVPASVQYKTYCHFLQKAKQIGVYA